MPPFLSPEMSTISASANARRAGENYMAGVTHLDSGPTSMALTLGTSCNNYCRFCRIHETKNPFRLNENMIGLIRRYAPGLHSLTLTGGEPLVYASDIHRLIDEGVLHDDMHITLMTNGILLEECADWLAERPSLSLSVALNVASEKAYHYLHQTDHFRKVAEGIQCVRQRREGKPTRILLKMLIMRSTCQEIVTFAELAKSLGADVVHYRDLRWNEGMAIDRSERILMGSPSQRIADEQLQEAERLLQASDMKFSFLGWETRRDDIYDDNASPEGREDQ